MSREGDAPRSEPGSSSAYSNYVLVILFVAYVFNFVDRQIINFVGDPIKEEFGISDTQLGLLKGTVFALFYAALGLPIARLADIWVRRHIIGIGIAVWSLFTAASGLVTSYAQLLAARVGVGVGEAALSPPAHSLIADYFPPERRATAMGIYFMGVHVGVLFGAVLGGTLEQYWGWRRAFIVVGLPGVALALLLWLTVREPPRRTQKSELPAVSAVLEYLWRLKTFRHLTVATSLTALSGFSFVAWAPDFLRRVHLMQGAELGLKFGLVLGVAAAIGSVVAGSLADRLGRRNPRWALWVPTAATLAPLPFQIVFFFHANPDAALAILFPGVFLAAWYQAPVFSTALTLAPERMRSVASGILIFFVNLIGLALGPPLVGFLNDYVFDHHGTQAVAYSMSVVMIVMGVWGLIHFLLAAQSYPEELEATRNTA